MSLGGTKTGPDGDIYCKHLVSERSFVTGGRYFILSIFKSLNILVLNKEQFSTHVSHSLEFF